MHEPRWNMKVKEDGFGFEIDLKFIKAEFDIAVLNESQPYREPILGYFVEGMPYDEDYPIAVHKVDKGWVATFRETGLRCKGLPQQTRFDAVYVAVAFLDSVRDSKKLSESMAAAARRFKRMTRTVKRRESGGDS